MDHFSFQSALVYCNPCLLSVSFEFPGKRSQKKKPCFKDRNSFLLHLLNRLPRMERFWEIHDVDRAFSSLRAKHYRILSNILRQTDRLQILIESKMVEYSQQPQSCTLHRARYPEMFCIVYMTSAQSDGN